MKSLRFDYRESARRALDHARPALQEAERRLASEIYGTPEIRPIPKRHLLNQYPFVPSPWQRRRRRIAAALRASWPAWLPYVMGGVAALVTAWAVAR